jgi:hypothetical protein
MRLSLRWLWRMQSSVKWRHVTLVRTDVSEKHITPITRMKGFSEVGTTVVVTSYWNKLLRNTVLHLLVTANILPTSQILFTIMMEAVRSSETPFYGSATRRHIPENDILHNIFSFNWHVHESSSSFTHLLSKRFIFKFNKKKRNLNISLSLCL